ncbi:hypothetical protein [Enterococcus faecalis]|uniref:hypothetical protein n=1 Tax=Enterococcus TaxID=1350 RepID=UPI001A963E8F|nr:hypothetical protein [Enterococcus faecalis]
MKKNFWWENEELNEIPNNLKQAGLFIQVAFLLKNIQALFFSPERLYYSKIIRLIGKTIPKTFTTLLLSHDHPHDPHEYVVIVRLLNSPCDHHENFVRAHNLRYVYKPLPRDYQELTVQLL